MESACAIAENEAFESGSTGESEFAAFGDRAAATAAGSEAAQDGNELGHLFGGELEGGHTSERDTGGDDSGELLIVGRALNAREDGGAMFATVAIGAVADRAAGLVGLAACGRGLLRG